MDVDGPRAAFVVDGELDPMTGEPADGFTYLKTVRWESNRLPDTHVSTVDPRVYDQFQTRKVTAPVAVPQPPPDRLPSPKWTKQVLKLIQEMRTQYFDYRRVFEEDTDQIVNNHKYPQLKDEAGWNVFFFGNESASSAAEEPLLSHLIKFDEVTVLKLLKLLIRWSTTTTWTRQRLLWLFSMLVCLDLPIDADTQADLWKLRKSCCSSRANDQPIPDDIIAGLNMIIITLEYVFNQKDC